MANYTIQYANLALGVATHGVLLVYDSNNNLVESFQGQAIAPDGNWAAIGAESLGYTLGARAYPNGNPLLTSSEPIVVASGPEADLPNVLNALTLASNKINEQNLPYQLPTPLNLLPGLR
jgi:hypothetical protein